MVSCVVRLPIRSLPVHLSINRSSNLVSCGAGILWEAFENVVGFLDDASHSYYSPGMSHTAVACMGWHIRTFDPLTLAKPRMHALLSLLC